MHWNITYSGKGPSQDPVIWGVDTSEHRSYTNMVVSIVLV